MAFIKLSQALTVDHLMSKSHLHICTFFFLNKPLAHTVAHYLRQDLEEEGQKGVMRLNEQQVVVSRNILPVS